MKIFRKPAVPTVNWNIRHRSRVIRRWISVGRGSNFLDPTQPDPQVKWLNPTRPRINMKLWTRPMARRIYARLLVSPSAAESFRSSTTWLLNSYANIVVSRLTSGGLLLKQHVLNVGIKNWTLINGNVTTSYHYKLQPSNNRFLACKLCCICVFDTGPDPTRPISNTALNNIMALKYVSRSCYYSLKVTENGTIL